MGNIKKGGYKPKTSNIVKLKKFLNKTNDKLGTNTK